VEDARNLANDPEPESEGALVKGGSNKNWKVRAALEALAHRSDPRLLGILLAHVADKNQAVRCAAAAGIIRVSSAKESEVQQSSTVP
jgi:HEAT repeat protein